MNFFESQDIARKNTSKLVFLFVLAVICLIVASNFLVMVVLGLIDLEWRSGGNFWQQPDLITFSLISVAVIAVVAIGSLYKIQALAGGGVRVVEVMNATLIVGGSDDAAVKTVLNVVEEIALASGSPVPPVYLLEEEGVNAFAAGLTPSDAVIGITRGALTSLTRDELQGVIAHEFSHIFRGDMRLNIRLMGILHGFLVLGVMGNYFLHSGTSVRPGTRDAHHPSNGLISGAAIQGMGIGLLIAGYAGTLLGNLIKASICRQRKFLADAWAVQYTGNPAGIPAALKRIGEHDGGGGMEHPGVAEISHSLFSCAPSSFLPAMLATHPPLSDRIRRIEPDWDGNFDSVRQPSPIAMFRSSSEDDEAKREKNITTGPPGVTVADAVINQVGTPTATHIQFSNEILTRIAQNLKSAARDPALARAVIYFLLLNKHEEVLNQQMKHLNAVSDAGVFEETHKLLGEHSKLDPAYRLPLIYMALSSLRQLSKKQYLVFRKNLTALIAMDNKMSLFEWSLQKIVYKHLDTVFVRQPAFGTARHKKFTRVQKYCALLLSVLIHTNRDKSFHKQAAFDRAKGKLPESVLTMNLVAERDISLLNLNESLDQLAALSPLLKPALLRACAVCIIDDRKPSTLEKELFRAIADCLDCPMPPLLL